MSKLLDKQLQLYVQIEILKIIYRGSRKPMRKVCDENERKNDDCIIFVVEGGIYTAVSEKWWDQF